MTYTERLEKDYNKALDGGMEMMKKSQELLLKGCNMIDNSPADSNEYNEGLRLLGESEMLKAFYDKMFY